MNFVQLMTWHALSNFHGESGGQISVAESHQEADLKLRTRNASMPQCDFGNGSNLRFKVSFDEG
jgi:hypothetical protein